MAKPATTTPDPEFNIPATGEPKKATKPDPSSDQATRPPDESNRPGPQVNLERLNHEEELQDEPDITKEDG